MIKFLVLMFRDVFDLYCNYENVTMYLSTLWFSVYVLLNGISYTVKPVYKGHSKEPENVAFISSCPLYTG